MNSIRASTSGCRSTDQSTTPTVEICGLSAALSSNWHGPVPVVPDEESVVGETVFTLLEPSLLDAVAVELSEGRLVEESSVVGVIAVFQRLAPWFGRERYCFRELLMCRLGVLRSTLCRRACGSHRQQARQASSPGSPAVRL